MTAERIRPLPPEPPAEEPISAGHKWAITGSVMLVTVMQVLDVTITNVALPHIQGSLAAGVDEVSWVLTSYLAANAVVLPATGWLASVLGRKRFFLICATVFTLASVLCGLAPNIETLLLARMLQGFGGGPLMPLSQAIMWEIFPLRQRGMAMAAWVRPACAQRSAQISLGGVAMTTRWPRAASPRASSSSCIAAPVKKSPFG